MKKIKEVKTNRTTKIVVCSCHHDYQDKKYGKFKRLANLVTKNNNFRCTVCEKEH